MNNNLPSIKILGTTITSAPEEQILEYIFKRIGEKGKKFYIVTPNPEILMFALRYPSYQRILNDAVLSIPDGIGVLMAGKVLKKKIIGRITGVDLMEKMCDQSSKRPINIGLLGGRGSVAEMTAECLRKKYPGLRVVFANSEWNASQITDFRRQITQSKASNLKSEIGNRKSNHIDILFVAFGFPKQEEWIAKNLESLPVTCAMGVGGAFDYISGKVPRAPKLIRSAGMEWAFRLLVQPWRVKRQLVLPQFVLEVLKERF